MDKIRKFFYLFIYLTIISILSSCASSGNLTGGPKDVTPPKIDSIKSDKNFQTNVSKRIFKFYFDEFIQVRDVVKQVLVSPPLVYIPKVKARGKEVEFSFNEKEELKANTTYIVNFGEAISDFNESNKLKKFKLVFSTGDIIDFLELKGKVLDENDKPVKDVLVMLYDVLNDTIVTKKKPYYYAKTDEEGNYHLQNIKKDTFKIIALKDENSNLLYNELNEAIGFIDKEIYWENTTLVNQNLIISKAEAPFRIIDTKTDVIGKLGFKLASKVDYIPMFKTTPKLKYLYPELTADSLIVWYKSETLDSFTVLFEKDTIGVKIPDSTKQIRKLRHNYQLVPIAFIPYDTISIQFSQPIDSVNKAFISIKDTNDVDIDFSFIFKDKTLNISSPLASKKQYKLSILPNAVKDIYNNTNDTISIDITTVDVEKLSSLNIELLSLDSSQQYIIQLLKGNNVFKSEVVKDVKTLKLDYKNIKSDDYTIIIIEDENRNGIKDVSNYWLKRQSEKAKSLKFEKLRENWIMDQTVDYKTMSIPTLINEPSTKPNATKNNINSNRKK